MCLFYLAVAGISTQCHEFWDAWIDWPERQERQTQNGRLSGQTDGNENESEEQKHSVFLL